MAGAPRALPLSVMNLIVCAFCTCYLFKWQPASIKPNFRIINWKTGDDVIWAYISRWVKRKEENKCTYLSPTKFMDLKNITLTRGWMNLSLCIFLTTQSTGLLIIILFHLNSHIFLGCFHLFKVVYGARCQQFFFYEKQTKYVLFKRKKNDL